MPERWTFEADETGYVLFCDGRAHPRVENTEGVAKNTEIARERCRLYDAEGFVSIELKTLKL